VNCLPFLSTSCGSLAICVSIILSKHSAAIHDEPTTTRCFSHDSHMSRYEIDDKQVPRRDTYNDTCRVLRTKFNARAPHPSNMKPAERHASLLWQAMSAEGASCEVLRNFTGYGPGFGYAQTASIFFRGSLKFQPQQSYQPHRSPTQLNPPWPNC